MSVTEIRALASAAKQASRRLASLDRGVKDRALHALAVTLRANVERIGEANERDLTRGREAGLQAAMLDRLGMGPKVVEASAAAVEFVATLPDPVGSRSTMQRMSNGMLVGRQRLPLGLVAIVYEARPNVTVDAAALCLKSGNAVLLRGGKEARDTNAVLGELVRSSLAATGLPADAVQTVAPTDREGIKELVGLSDLVDLAIPRGGEALIRFVAEHARVPVIKHFKGVCHLFLDASCDHEMAVRLTLNGKVQRPGVCNALEGLLVHAAEAPHLLPKVARALLDRGVELRGCPRTCGLVPEAKPASDEDWGTEFLDLILAVRVVEGLDEALAYIERYGSNHTEAICTESHSRAERWLREVDASCVLVNASTRFNDGGQLGLGAEMGISTTKMHVYGPMGLEGLTAEKWIVLGDGQTRG